MTAFGIGSKVYINGEEVGTAISDIDQDGYCKIMSKFDKSTFIASIGILNNTPNKNGDVYKQHIQNQWQLNDQGVFSKEDLDKCQQEMKKEMSIKKAPKPNLCPKCQFVLNIKVTHNKKLGKDIKESFCQQCYYKQQDIIESSINTEDLSDLLAIPLTGGSGSIPMAKQHTGYPYGPKINQNHQYKRTF